MKNKAVALDAIQCLVEDAERVIPFRWSQYYKEIGKGAPILVLDDLKERIVLWKQVLEILRNLAMGIVPTLTSEQLFAVQNELRREIAHRKHMSNVFRKKMRFDAKQTEEFNKFLTFRDRGVQMQTLINSYYSKQTLFG